MTDNDDGQRLRRLRMRSWRRGMKEMDLILGPFADGPLSGLSAAMLDSYEALMAENDQDLYRWISGRLSGRADGPAALAPLLDVIAEHAQGRLRG
ncbi:succinate dehydrogenase assembly factor 2 [Paracoccus sp. M683]|uniref:FAD assembly factor SdhE n=1 Tax=Paracoccus sp. M683 TaxID=2594268 RepID=UPI00117D6E99|nr:succinate dehydrogenase assembly factor 2 [Paracoccus sp. M683]TRW98414.1 succinate dehydrogenase assembly factor 2 [Paracoccus sp. M683]